MRKRGVHTFHSMNRVKDVSLTAQKPINLLPIMENAFQYALNTISLKKAITNVLKSVLRVITNMVMIKLVGKIVKIPLV